MAHMLRLVFTISVFTAMLPNTARCERIVVIEGDASDVEPTAFSEEQFRYELGIVLDQQEVVPVAPMPDDFAALPLEEKLRAAASLCEANEADAALWLEKSQGGIVGLGLLVTTPGGKLGRSVTFDNPVTAPADLALIAKELLEHSRSFAERAEATADGWIPLPGEDEAETPAETGPTPPPGDIGIIRDEERPGQRPEPPPQVRRKRFETAVHVTVSQGIAAFKGPGLYLGGELSGAFLPLARLAFSAAFGGAAGPRLKQSAERITGFKLDPSLGAFVPFVLGKVGVDLFLDLAMVYTSISVDSPGFLPLTSTWWSFSPDLGLRIVAPSTKTVAFSFRLSFCLETNGKQIKKAGPPDVEFIKTPMLSIQLAAGITFSGFRIEAAPTAPRPGGER